MNTGPDVTTEDHEAGFKELEVNYRSGRRETIKLVAPSHRKGQQLSLEIQTSKDTLCVVRAALGREFPVGPEDTAEYLMDRLTIESAAQVETAAFALTFGSDFQKKMEAFGEQFQREMDSITSAAKSKSSEPVILLQPSGNSVCRNCGCITPYVVKLVSPMTSEPSTSAPLPA